MKQILRFLFSGLAMGAADVVPGVSGGTIAFILGIYPRLLSAIEAFNLRFIRLLLRLRLREALALIPWDFLLPLLCGIGFSIFSLAKAVTYALGAWPVVIWSFFFGLILASILILSRDLRLAAPGTWLALALGAAAGWLIGGAQAVDLGQSLPIFFFSGFIAICAMILPGISGAFILVLLGQYQHVIQAVADLNFTVLGVFALGCLCGLVSFARLLNRLLKLYPNALTAFLTGLMGGSLRSIWPWRGPEGLAWPESLNSEVYTALLCALAGILLPLLLHLAAKAGRRSAA
ncbi:DUF368 domain-containing protein [Desulfovibrio sp. OttesenSCG-928-C14]|nr:DUF368 domain-containing protein [Desulfovibrio sp. OttesenSCG-928-C14]